MPWPAFVEAYRAILAKSAERLKPNRFAVVVVGNFRDRRDNEGRQVQQDRPLRNLVGETIAACEASGLRWYDEAHLVTPVGTLAARTAYVWPRSRKIGRTHQTVLVFVKGCPKRATKLLQKPCYTATTEAPTAQTVEAPKHHNLKGGPDARNED